MANQEQLVILNFDNRTTHKKLDEAVLAAYSWKSALGDEEILEKLLSLNLERGK